MPEERPFLCSICFQPIKLENCKVDEDGRAVHEKCVIEMLLHVPTLKKDGIKKAAILRTWRRVG